MSEVDQRVHDVYLRLAQHYQIKGDIAMLRWTYPMAVSYYLLAGGC